ncbi:uncharacterized protein LOC115447722 [Manduca sexta]|uniref:uncharacterized protein LOC115447722 n=1 Tax=Manduca sexta TaxID=7130 RepID=UPI00188F94D6|nr:uncharacterized protein LOC115447722 [Manduca sexta]
MNRLVLLFALVAIAYARPESEMVDLDVDSSAGADVGKDDLTVTYIPQQGLKFGEGFLKGLGNTHQKGPNPLHNKEAAVSEQSDVGAVNADSNVQAMEDDLSASYIPVQGGAAHLIDDLSDPKSHH